MKEYLDGRLKTIKEELTLYEGTDETVFAYMQGMIDMLEEILEVHFK